MSLARQQFLHLPKYHTFRFSYSSTDFSSVLKIYPPWRAKIHLIAIYTINGILIYTINWCHRNTRTYITYPLTRTGEHRLRYLWQNSTIYSTFGQVVLTADERNMAVLKMFSHTISLVQRRFRSSLTAQAKHLWLEFSTAGVAKLFRPNILFCFFSFSSKLHLKYILTLNLALY